MTLVPNETEQALNHQYDVYAAAREEYRKKIDEQAAEIERLRAALREITDFEVFGFAITDTHSGGDVFCEGTNRFVREDDVVKIRRIARAALEERT